MKRVVDLSGNASARSGPASRLRSFTDLTEKAAGNPAAFPFDARFASELAVSLARYYFFASSLAAS
ncbi:hypothetical protein AB4084_40570, partial [Lysobacter sp. 2RAB21]